MGKSGDVQHRALLEFKSICDRLTSPQPLPVLGEMRSPPGLRYLSFRES
ncbi:hypothetical protein [Geitlerinema sp. P-1104]|nr:hypothetical protein [Geitlerinema sp. P-1104]